MIPTKMHLYKSSLLQLQGASSMYTIGQAVAARSYTGVACSWSRLSTFFPFFRTLEHLLLVVCKTWFFCLINHKWSALPDALCATSISLKDHPGNAFFVSRFLLRESPIESGPSDCQRCCSQTYFPKGG